MNSASALARYRQALQWESAWEAQVLGAPVAGTPYVASRRRRAGAFFTPFYLVDLLVRHTLGPMLAAIRREVREAAAQRDVEGVRRGRRLAAELRICDPACGSGRFLLAAFRWLYVLHLWLAEVEAQQGAGQGRLFKAGAVFSSQAAEKALASLYGNDVDEQALACAAQVLALASGVRPDLPRLQRQDALFHPIAADVVLGNPPWGAEGDLAAAARAAGLPAVNSNTCSIVLARAWQGLPPGGRLGFVIPRNFLKGHDYAATRRLLLESGQLEWVIDAGQPFAGVVQEAALMVLRKRHPQEPAGRTGLAGLVLKESGRVTLGEATWIDQRFFTAHSTALIALHMKEPAMAVLENMERAAVCRLRDVATWQRGLEYGHAGLLTCCPACGCYTSAPGKKRASKACPTCGHTLQPGNVAYRLIVGSPDQAHCRPIYAGRQVGRYRLAAPGWVDPALPGIKYKPHVDFASPKVLVPKIAPGLAAAWDESGAYVTQGVYILRPAPQMPDWNGHALLGWLNSAAVAFYYEHRFNDKATLTTNLVLAHLLDLPVPALPGAPWRAVAHGAALLSADGRPAAAAPAAARALEDTLDDAIFDLYRLNRDNQEEIRRWRGSAGVFRHPPVNAAAPPPFSPAPPPALPKRY